ncbi:DUF5343 domain-containing protein [Pseudothioclava nitratireducens]|uniref:DUF5343 domain-containing protein n=1 Tax=Pseudothioclava nitratireducens TaxID=1928646 RepID=UPI0023DA7A79|nr:DUF5343 domain-containing protein [Defluviimonas nitratireducens]MDF1620975.1 DUF5343 domain-containing protein [Defluviimonas nitratireducens]
MASHPYISGAGNISQMIGFLRKNFPATVTSETVKKFGLASNNESYVINALQFIGVIDEEGKRTKKGQDAFVLGDDAFPSAFEGLVKEAYHDLFDLRGDDAWSLSKSELTSYFRTTDKTSEVIGGRQAGVFITFRALAGHEHPSDKPASTTTKPASAVKSKPAASKKMNASAVGVATKVSDQADKKEPRRDMALTVRIEINLPANGTQETYDAIFKSIKANLIND